MKNINYFFIFLSLCLYSITNQSSDVELSTQSSFSTADNFDIEVSSESNSAKTADITEYISEIPTPKSFPATECTIFTRENSNALFISPELMSNLEINKFSKKDIKKLKRLTKLPDDSFSQEQINRFNKLLTKAIIQNNQKACKILCHLPIDPTIQIDTDGKTIVDLANKSNNLIIKKLFPNEFDEDDMDLIDRAWDN